MMKNIQPKKASSTRSGCGPATTTAPTAHGADPGPKQPDRSPPGRHRASAPTTSHPVTLEPPKLTVIEPDDPPVALQQSADGSVIEPDTDDPDDPDVPLVALRQSDGSVIEPDDGGPARRHHHHWCPLIVDGNGV